MTDFSDQLEADILDAVFRGTTYTAQTNVYISINEADINDDASGAPGNEFNGKGGYARVAVTADETEWSGSGGTTDNVASIAFPQATEDWGTAAVVGIWDNATASASANLLFHGSLTAAKSIASADTFKIAAGALDITLD